jgi:hypothetical protein
VLFKSTPILVKPLSSSDQITNDKLSMVNNHQLDQGQLNSFQGQWSLAVAALVTK